MKLSIIIPVFNPKKSFYTNIKKIDSLCKNRKDTEIIIVDDSSKNKVFINKKLNSNFILLKNKFNLGPGLARNIGIKKSKGEYIMFLDSDDTLSDNSIDIIAKFINKNKNIELFGYNHRLLLDKKIYNYKVDDKFNNTKNKILNDFLTSSTNPSAIFYIFKKNFLIKHNIYFKKGIHEDILFMFKVFFYVKKKRQINKILYIKYNNTHSIINNIDEKRINDYFNAFRDLYIFFISKSNKNKYKTIKKYYYKGQSGYIFQIVNFIIRKKLSYKVSIKLLLFTHKKASDLFQLEKLPKKTYQDQIVDIYLNEIKYIYNKKNYEKFCNKLLKYRHGKT